MNHNTSWNLNQTASYPLCKQPNSVRRCNVPPRDDQFDYPHVAGRRFEKNNFSNTAVAIQRQNLKTSTTSMRMQQTRQKLLRQNLSLDFATDNCDFVC